MAIYRNPFLTRFSDRTGLKNSVFLSMYAPQVVSKLLKDEHLFLPKASWIMGIPGVGKSSILRLFSADILIEIIKQKLTYPQLYDVLSEIGIIEGDEIRWVGLYLQIDEFYSDTANVVIPGIGNERLFYTLFDLRVAKQLLYTLEQVNYLNSQNYNLKVVKAIASDLMPPRIFSKNISLEKLKNSIQKIEINVAEIINSFPGTPIPKLFDFHSRFACFDLIDAQLKASNLKFILMVDDAHDLYPDQYQILKKAIERRMSFPRWVATRKHIFTITELLGNASKAMEGREVNTVDLDSETINSSLFKKFVKVLVDRRLTLTSSLNEFTSDQIEGMLSKESSIDEEKKQAAIRKQRDEARRLNNKFITKIPELEHFIDGGDIDPEDAELLLIKTNRMANKRQLSMFPDIDPLANVASKDKQASKLFWKKRAGLPIYSGFEDIISISNRNVEQFLRVFSPIIDRLIYRVELDKDTMILEKEQKTIIDKVATNYIHKIISRLYLGDKITQLIENLGNFFSYKTYEPNAPHAPGVTQFALLSSDIEKLKKPFDENQWIKQLSSILAIAIAHNVIVPEGAQKQGVKNSELKHIFSLNRLICLKYSLPLQKGDFQLLPLKLLHDMCNNRLSIAEIKRRKSGQLPLWEKNSDQI
jgi:hypothetical protein